MQRRLRIGQADDEEQKRDNVENITVRPNCVNAFVGCSIDRGLGTMILAIIHTSVLNQTSLACHNLQFLLWYHL